MKLLVVDDKPDVRGMLKDFFGASGYSVLTATNGSEALMLTRSEHPDVILLDVAMPEMDGHEFLAQLRRDSNVPVIMLTAKREEVDRLTGFELGADDYVTKPFSVLELRARIQAVTKRAVWQYRPDIVQIGEMTIDKSARQVSVAGTPVPLTEIEYQLIVTLSSTPGKAFSRRELLDRLDRYEGSEKTISVHMHNLRAKIEPDPNTPRYVETVFGLGYRFMRR